MCFIYIKPSIHLFKFIYFYLIHTLYIGTAIIYFFNGYNNVVIGESESEIRHCECTSFGQHSNTCGTTCLILANQKMFVSIVRCMYSHQNSPGQNHTVLDLGLTKMQSKLRASSLKERNLIA